MAKAGGRAGKVFSSGRLPLSVRPATCRKRAAVRKPSVDSASSLCSSDSEDQVVDINRGLDRCAALLQDILQCDAQERVLRPHKMPSAKGNVRPSTAGTRKTAVRKVTPTAGHVCKEKGPLRRTLPPGLCNAEVQRPTVSSPPPMAPSQNLEYVATQMQRLNRVPAPATCSAASGPGHEASALYNCRLPSSTPTLSPRRPANPQSCGDEDFHQTLSAGGALHFPPASAPAMSDHIAASAPYNSAEPNVLSQLDHYRGLIRDSDLLRCVAAHLAQVQLGDGPTQNQAAPGCRREEPPTESDAASGDEDEAGAAPGRAVDCRTERKVRTVKYLLQEIRALVADQGDGEAVRLVTELERSASLLPSVPGSVNVQAEIALALQPLRSENAQLRRRLRILNQQLRDRERAARSEEHSSEVSSLQSMNETLQHQLDESQRELESLQSKNAELLMVMEIQKEESRTMAQTIQEKEQEVLQEKQQKDVLTANGKKELDEALGRMKSAQFKLEASEKEKQILGITVRQRDTEVARLRELTRTLQASMAKLLCDLGKDAPTPRAAGSCTLTRAALGSYDRQLQGEQCAASTSIMNYLKRLESERALPGSESLHPDRPLLPGSESLHPDRPLLLGSESLHPDRPLLLGSESLHPDRPLLQVSSGQGGDHYTAGKVQGLQDGHKSTRPPNPPDSPPRARPETGSESGYGDEQRPDETLYLPLVSSPCNVTCESSLGRMWTPPKICPAERDLRGEYDPHNGRGSSEKDPPHTSALDGAAAPALQQRRNLWGRDDTPRDRSLLGGKPDWSICSFSTFTSHDEQDFRNGLAALDANIAKLQRSLQNGSRK